MAPIPGETKVWQYITLMKRIYLIDCPGVVPPNMGDTDEDILLRGVVRVENVHNPEQYVAAALKKCKRHHVERTYDVKDWTNHTEFLEALSRKGGRLLKGGEADMDGVAKMVLNDFLRGKIPWFTPPPSQTDAGDGVDGRKGKLGEMPGEKRKRDVADDGEVVAEAEEKIESEDEDDDDFGGFSDEESDEPAVDEEEDEEDDDSSDSGEGVSLLEDGKVAATEEG